MIRLIFLNNPKDPLTNFVWKEIEKTYLLGVENIDISKYDKYISKYKLSYNHTLIFEFDGKEVARLEGPFNAQDLSFKFQEVLFVLSGPDLPGGIA